MILKSDEFDSLGELKKTIQELPNGILLNQDCEAPRRFWLLHVTFGESVFSIGVIANQNKEPGLLQPKDSGIFLIGFDQVVFILDLAREREETSLLLNGVFFGFFELTNDKCVVAFHELGFLMLRACQNRINSLSYDAEDVLESYDVEDSRVTLKLMNGDLVSISIPSGALCGHKGLL